MEDFYSDTLRMVRDMVPATRPARRDLVRQVVVIMSASRSGSTYLKTLLSQHPDIAALPGEAEPYYTLSGSGFPLGSDSDAIGSLQGLDAMASRIEQALLVNERPPLSELPRVLAEQWAARLPLQVMRYFDTEVLAQRWLGVLDVLDDREDALDAREGGATSRFLKATVPQEAKLYDIVRAHQPFMYMMKIEEPPFVHVPFRRPVRQDELPSKVLLFKTPQDVYRPGLYETLYPNAAVRYVHLTRNFASAVNGLMDGWECDYGFFAHNVLTAGTVLDILGYSDRFWYGKMWWKFDMTPDWRRHTKTFLPLVCLQQWLSANEAALNRPVARHTVKFERLLGPTMKDEVAELLRYLGLRPWSFKQLGMVMATEDPVPNRWRRRQDVIMQLAERPDAASMMGALGYTMIPETWS